jgi:Hint domain
MPAPIIDVIGNGDFEDTPSIWNGQSWIIVSGLPGGWTGTDIEWGRQSNYIGGPNPSNWVIEMDGNGGSAITQIQQSFTTGGKVNAVLSFDMALRNGLSTTAGEGFRVDVLDSFNNVIQTQTYTPSTNSWTPVTLTVPFDVAGTYSIRFTELGPNNSLGAIIDDISLLICFAAGTLIDTPLGACRVEDLRPGDLVSTADRGPQSVRWVGRRTVTRDEMRRDPRLWPVTIAAGAFGPAQPARDLAVSRQHRILRGGWACELYFAEPEVLIPAHKLVNGRTVRLDPPRGDVTYVHFLCDRHEIVFAEGLASESFYPSAQSLDGVEAEAQAELLLIFPELRARSAPPLAIARPLVEPRLAKLMA